MSTDAGQVSSRPFLIDVAASLGPAGSSVVVARGRSADPASRRWSWGWAPPRLAFGALAAAIIAVGVWQFASGPAPSEASIVVNSAATEDPRAALMVYSTPERDVAVVWVFGLE